jgi:hypothetical protein
MLERTEMFSVEAIAQMIANEVLWAEADLSEALGEQTDAKNAAERNAAVAHTNRAYGRFEQLRRIMAEAEIGGPVRDAYAAKYGKNLPPMQRIA